MKKLQLFIVFLIFNFPAIAQNYQATQGSGTTFGTKLVGGVNYPQQTMCDPTTPANCVSVNASGQISVLQAGTWNVGITGTPTISGTVTANAGTNLNTSALALESGGNLAAAASGIGATGDAAATAGGTGSLTAKTRLMTTQLGTINTTLGSPFQAGGSIGNTSFGATQSGTWTVQPGNTANTTAWLVTGTGGTFPATQSGTWNIGSITTLPALASGSNIIGRVGIDQTTPGTTNLVSIGTNGTVNPTTAANWGLGATAAAVPANANYWGINVSGNLTGVTGLSLGSARAPTVAIVDGSGNQITSFGGSGGTASNFGSTFPTAGTAAGMSQGGNMVALTGTSGNLNVQCANCSGSGASAADASAFTAGSSVLAPGGGFYQTTATSNALTNGQQGMWQMTANRAGFVNLRNSSGTEIGVSGAELFVGGRGTAGSAAGGVLTVQGAASMTALAVSQAASSVASGAYSSGAFASGAFASGAFAAGSQVDLLTMRGTVSGGTAASNSLLTGAIYNSTPITVTNGQGAALQSDANGFLKVNVATATGLAQGSTTSGQSGSLIMGAVTTSAPTYTTAQTSPLSLDTSGALRVTGGGGGAVTIASGAVASGAYSSGAFASGSIASGALASGSIASGAMVDLLTMRGTKNNGTAASNSLLAGGVYNSTPLTLTDTQQASLQFDANGYLKVNTAAGGAAGGTSSNFSSAFPSAGTAIGLTNGTNMVPWSATSNYGSAPSAIPVPAVNAAVTNSVTVAQGTAGNLNATVVGTGTFVTQSTVSSNTAPVSTMNSTSANSGVTAASAYVFDDVTPTSITENNFGYARMSANRNQYQTIRDAAGNERGVNVTAGNALVVDGSAVTQPVSATNLSTNISQINAVTPLMGNGATGTGSLRVTLANDSSAIAAKGEGATGSAAPAGAQQIGMRSGANLVAATQANASVAISGNSAATAQLVALSASAVIHVTSFDFMSAGTANVTLVYGTGTNCGTGTTSLTGAYPLTAQAGVAKGSGTGPVLVVPAGNALCWTNSAAVQVSGSISYTQFVP